MLSEYLNAALRHAHYEILKDDGGYYGEIAACRGVYASAPTLEQCRSELARVLEDWLLLRIHKHLALPEIDGLDLTVNEEEIVT
jgi:predicted RNase H-like HicB family nuclease